MLVAFVNRVSLCLSVVLALSASSAALRAGDTWAESRSFAAPEAVQAAAADEVQAFVVSNTGVALYERATGVRISVTECPGATHLNSAFVHEGKVYCSHSNYPETPERSEIRVFNPIESTWDVFHDFGQSDGSLTWAVFHDSAWWCFFAFYDANNVRSYLAKFEVGESGAWQEVARWTLPQSLLEKLGGYSLSGGTWLHEELLVSGHSAPLLFRLRVPENGSELEFIAEDSVPIEGQGFAIDPASGGVVGIRRSDSHVVFADPPRSRPLRLRILSYNIHHGEGMDGKLDIARIAKVISSVNPDLVSVQEVDQGAERTGRMDQPDELAKLTGLNVVFEGNIPLQGGKYGNAILSRFPIASYENHRLPNEAKREQRGLLTVQVELPDGRQGLQFMATHFDAQGNDDKDRLRSAQFIKQIVASSPGVLTILAGDLNARLGSRPLEELLPIFSLPQSEEQPTSPSTKPRRQIDFILFTPSDRVRPIETRVIEEPVASDHCAILTTLELLP